MGSFSFRASGIRGTLFAGALLILFAVALRFVGGAYSVPSASMEPTLLPGDHLLVVRYFGEEPLRGHVVVFDNPSGTSLVKRVIGLPGDSVQMDHGNVLVNGEPLVEGDHVAPSSSQDVTVHVVPQGHLFLLGDNRDHSADSREFGFVPVSAVVGRARMIYWSVAPGGSGVRWSRLFHSVE